ncbi:MAG: 30S ribosomal protein S1 [Candidatus Kuenenia stuttgartiensis]|jgi:small subunit ribosomal protein S1|uniref:30S ribosomal protein S1 n=1 Tax=Kuenenia stuttgartiensis TaxID=174633 RepID=Q1PZV8_KUEST|nr:MULTISPECIES: 30S ribosomal protein S1 [Kuenenia]MBE7546615.1 30S ribosomal protein S1 [Planctomycetia bacterium]MBW7942277.1 30S ribosomal protein S1 [Candidatus Kuenenia stuttgartiensis]MBZ0192301.1 30S ribosomal protein S1 [Candidatus Kuenenia stuttgartiensis]MCF6151243.1 30S ribosomal protein S1 [Candidatus Kuenenia stuttgartiensis]MCL4726017.1 30S ribosomal protein S1 [Candidatus Kuenenia stuttgartiensis]
MGLETLKRDYLKEYNVNVADIENDVESVMATEDAMENVQSAYYDSVLHFEVNSILKGRIISSIGDNVIIDCGYKSEGMVPKYEFDDPSEIRIGEEIEVLLEAVEDDSGLIKLSKRKADRIRGWETVIAKYKEGDIITGRIIRKIKGGLLVDIGVPIFLPASQIDVKPPGDIAQYVGQELTCRILKIDEERQNIVVSRRKLIEEEREKKKKLLLMEIEAGQTRKGVVKNIADFGAFIDLGGMDGLLHITDMSWGRISHPSEMLAIDDEVEVKILDVDKEKEKVALGLKQKTDNPWFNIEEKYPVGSRVKGQVVNIMSYGAFVKLETGIEGLVHISEMSWTRRINHPSEIVAIGDMVEVVVLKIDREKEEISLSIKQTEVNPWTIIEEKYPAGTKIKGRVRNLTNYGAFIEIEEGVDGLLHISDMSWAKKVAHPSEIVKKGDKIEAVVLSVDREKKRVALGLKQLQDDPWEKEIPEKYKVGDIVKGHVTKLANFGAFLELGQGIEGLLHVSEFSDKKISNPADAVNVGDELEVKVIRIEPEARKIGLSLKKIAAHPEEKNNSSDNSSSEKVVQEEKAEPSSVVESI